MKSEANRLTTAIINYLGYKGIFAWRNNNTGVYDPVKKVFRRNPAQLNGVSDIIGVAPNGKFIGVEVKIGSDKQSDFQKRFEAEIKERNGVYLVAKNLDDVTKYFGD